jgi:5'(3')-deoxyribonucleotidase
VKFKHRVGKKQKIYMTTNTFYLDMDGVVADWDTAASAFLGRPQRPANDLTHYKNTPEEWSRIKTQSRFYRDLPLMPRCSELVDLARRYRDGLGWNLLFLTAVPKDDDVPWAFYDKVLWAQEHFPDIPVHFGPHSWDKQRHCLPGDILVDDRPDNCSQWIESGGLAVQVLGNDLDEAISQVSFDLNRRMSLRSMASLNAMADAIVAAGGFKVGS